MNDLSIASRFNSSSDLTSAQLSSSLARLCDASARADELLASVPTLRQAARSLIGAALVSTGGKHNPDVLFLNHRTAEGSLLRSNSLTDAMVQTLIDGVNIFDSDFAAVYTRHDTVDQAFLAKHTNDEALRKLLAGASESLPAHYLDLLDEFWSQGVKSPDSDGLTVTRQSAWASRQLAAFRAELELSHLKDEVDEQEMARLLHVVSEPVGDSLYKVSLSTPGSRAALLHSTFVITLEPQIDGPLHAEGSTGPVFLLTVMRGIERFDSLSVLNQLLGERLADSAMRKHLLGDLSLAQGQLLTEVSDIAIEYTNVPDSLVRSLVRALRTRQIEDLHFLVQTATGTTVSTFLKSVSGSQALVYFDDARRHRFHAHMAHLQTLNTPHWLRHANKDEQASYSVFDTDYRRRAAAASQLFEGLESLEGYALKKVHSHIRQHLGYAVDPRKVFITLQDKWLSSEGEVEATYRKSLLDCALDGLPSIADDSAARVVLPDNYEHPDFSFEFVKDLVARLDLRNHYRQDLEGCYRRPDTQLALLHQRDTALALSAWAARLQHHISDKDLSLIWAARGDVKSPGSVVRVEGLEVGGVGNQLRDAILITEDTDTANLYVLYAPGAPGGRDIFSFSRWRQLYDEVAGWSATPSGREYLIAQSAPDFRDATARFMQEVSLKPTVWVEEDVRAAGHQQSSFQSSLGALINTTINYQLAQLPPAMGGQRGGATEQHLRQLALCDARIEFLSKRYKRSMQLISYSHFARLSGEIYISNILERKGFHETVNPDTVYFDLNSRTRRHNPDFGPHTDLVSLTQLLMNDFIYRLDDNAPMYSSIAQDLSSVSMEVIKEALAAPLGERYIQILKEDYGNRQHSDFAIRRSLFAQRNFFQIRRDILSTYLQKRFTPEQYQWALTLLSTVYPSGGEHSASGLEGISNSSINLLFIHGRLIERALVFKNNGTDDADFNLVYTPHAPDGICFRNYGIFVSTLKSPGMEAYYYNRVSYKDQPMMGTLFKALVRNPQTTLSSLTFGAGSSVRDLQKLHDSMIERMILDIDEQSLSRAESFAENLYTLVKWTGTILLLPFPPAALAWGVVNTSISLARGYLAYQDGDRATASGYFAWSAVGVVLGVLGAKDIARSAHGLGFKALRWAVRKSHPCYA